MSLKKNAAATPRIDATQKPTTARVAASMSRARDLISQAIGMIEGSDQEQPEHKAER